MLRKGMLFLTLTGFALALGLVGTKPALAQATKEKVCQDLDLTGLVLSNSCTGCDVTLTSGTATVCQQLVTDSNGGQHLTVHVQAQGQGVDCDGNKYVVVINQQAHQNDNIGPGANATIKTTIKAIGQGGAPNFNCHLLLHVTVNANGDVTSEIDKASSDCECLG